MGCVAPACREGVHSPLGVSPERRDQDPTEFLPTVPAMSVLLPSFSCLGKCAPLRNCVPFWSHPSLSPGGAHEQTLSTPPANCFHSAHFCALPGTCPRPALECPSPDAARPPAAVPLTRCREQQTPAHVTALPVLPDFLSTLPQGPRGLPSPLLQLWGVSCAVPRGRGLIPAPSGTHLSSSTSQCFPMYSPA